MRVSKTLSVLVSALMALLLCNACAVKFKKIRLDAAKHVVPLTGPDVALDKEVLYSRASGLYDQLKKVKLTANITRQKLAPYFYDDKNLNEFIAIYATLFRGLDFQREILQSYKIKNIIVEENGVIGLVDINLKGKIYFIWSAKVHEIQKWEKRDGIWYMVPQIFPSAPPKKKWFKNPWRKTYDEGPTT